MATSKCGRRLGFVGAAPALGQSRSQEAVADLLREHPEAMVLWDEGGEGTRARMLFGAPMTRAESPREAAEMFLFLYGEAFIDGDVELEESRVFPMKDGRPHERTVFAYRQTIEDVPVDGSVVRVMVSDFAQSPWDGRDAFQISMAAETSTSSITSRSRISLPRAISEPI